MSCSGLGHSVCQDQLFSTIVFKCELLSGSALWDQTSLLLIWDRLVTGWCAIVLRITYFVCIVIILSSFTLLLNCSYLMSFSLPLQLSPQFHLEGETERAAVWSRLPAEVKPRWKSRRACENYSSAMCLWALTKACLMIATINTTNELHKCYKGKGTKSLKYYKAPSKLLPQNPCHAF